MNLSRLLLIVSFAAAAYALEGAVTGITGGGGGGLALASDPEDKCVYTVYVRTGSIWNGGTDSVIGVTLLGSDGTGIRFDELENYGLMGPDHDYYERGNLDIFSGRGPCMARPPCWMKLTSDGTGQHHDWYCSYVEVTVTGPHLGCSQQLFTVDQWLATDASSNRLYAVRDYCPNKQPGSAPAAAAAGDDEAARVTAL